MERKDQIRVATDSEKTKQQAPSTKKPILREGNKAYDIERPFFDNQEIKKPLADVRKYLLQKIQDGDDQLMIGSLPTLGYLDDTDVNPEDQETVILASYPRSGNTLLRAYIERIMGFVTGSDCDIEKKLNKELMMMGLNGEGLVDKRVLVVKTHYPERYGKTKFYAEKCILEVRNPVDAVTSLFNMVCTGSHNKSMHPGDYAKFSKEWNEFIEQEITVWKDFHDFWLNAKIPVHLIRFEDILTDPRPTMIKLFKFILNTSHIEGTVIEKYIDLAVKEKAPEIYKPREGRVNTNMDKFNREQLDFMYNYAKEQLQYFGYDDTYTLNKLGLNSKFIDDFNNQNLEKSIFIQQEADEITSIFINYPALLLRKKSMLYPEGRTSYRFKRALRKKVTILDKATQHKPGEDSNSAEQSKQ
ncbi:fbox domain containing protein [Stylonychia lemnae]|uniref:Fbox domain containing protein n=1 Tax=Stylonychia lemnae TaxID=5949 RepID=A0A078ALC2_STYLE|nr:fbox domain containing protein [Stylonychia lemnae]|eukprot:CDW83009.1 fbox domain containing protein [Stylonychia lemnae]